MKTQNFGESKLYWTCTPLEGFMTPPKTLKNYRENRENGDALQDNPKWVFPSFGLENITALDFFDFDKYFVRENDEQRGFERFKGPQGQDATRYWYLFRHKESGTLIRGFSCEPDFKNSPPDEVLYVHRFTDTYCPAIRQWMEEKDLNYLRRIKCENPTLFQKEFEELKAINPSHPAISQLHGEVKANVQYLAEPLATLSSPSPELDPVEIQLLQSSGYFSTSHTLFAAPEVIPEVPPISSVSPSSDSGSNHDRCCCWLS